MNGKKNKGKLGVSGVLAILLAVALALTGFTNWYCFMQARNMDGLYLYGQVEDLVTEVIEGRISAGGVPAMKGLDFCQYGYDWADPEHVNAVMIDKDGRILAQTGTLATNGYDTLNLVMAPYSRYFDDWYYRDDEVTIYGERQGRLGLILDGLGEPVTSFMVTDASQTRMLGDVELPTYRNMFPTIDKDLYAYMMSEGDEEASGSGNWTPTAFKQAETYVAWENQYVEQVGGLRARIVPLTGGQAGRTVVLFFLSDDFTHGAQLGAQRMYNRANLVGTAFLALMLLFFIVLPIWVFRDAKRRAFKPALWGVLAIIGNVVAWLIYMIVRPGEGAPSVCPACGGGVSANFAFCPQCGHLLKNRCPNCHRAVAETWAVCPYCGTHLKEDGEIPAPSPQGVDKDG